MEAILNNGVLLFGLLILTTIVLVTIVCAINTIICNKRHLAFIKSIKVGDMFTYDNNVSKYYRWVDDYKHEMTNPFEKPLRFVYPDGTCIIKDIKSNDNGEIWIAYCLIKTSDDFSNINKLVEHYRSLDDFLKLRTRIEKFK